MNRGKATIDGFPDEVYHGTDAEQFGWRREESAERALRPGVFSHDEQAAGVRPVGM
jgi:hypothetical protein